MYIFEYQDLDLLGKKLPNIQKDIEQKFHQKIILKKEFTNIVTENKRHLVRLILIYVEYLNISSFFSYQKAYQELLDHTEAQVSFKHKLNINHCILQSRQRRIIHEQAMNSVAEQLEDQYQVQMMGK